MLATVVVVMLMKRKVAVGTLSALVVVYFLLRYFNSKIKPIYAAARDRLGDVSTRIQENLSGVVVIKIFGREEQEANRFRSATEAYYMEQIRAINARTIFFSFTRAVGFLSNVFMIGFGGWFILVGRGFTLGDLIAFHAHWGRLYGPLQTPAPVHDIGLQAT